MEVLVGCLATIVVVLATTLICWLVSRASKVVQHESVESKRTVLVFVDAPDPDNPAAVAAVAKNLPAITESEQKLNLHVVLTGRPVNLKTAKAKELLSKEDLVRQPWETSYASHTQRVLEDAAARFESYLRNCHIPPSAYTLYHGGVAPTAPLSDCYHEWDFLFDRRDLYTGCAEDKGSVVSFDEYCSLVDKYNGLSEDERETQFMRLLRPFDLTPLSALQETLKHSVGEVVLFLGGPATGLTWLFSGDGEALRERVSRVYGMFGALQPGQGTLLANQFNIACDIESACEFLITDIFRSARKLMVTTETCKNTKLVVLADDMLDTNIAPYFVKLHKLWELVHGDKAQPMFDVIPVLASLRKYENCFRWKRQKAVLKEWKRKNEEGMEQRFCFLDTSESAMIEEEGGVLKGAGLYVSDCEVDSLGKSDMLDFLKEVWS